MTDTASTGPPREVEAKLLISAVVPESTEERLAELRSIGRFELLLREPRHIRDSYFDVVGGLLGRQRIGLRLRDSEEFTLITLKADSRDTDTTSDRLEIEKPWSRHAVSEVLDELARHGIERAAPWNDLTGSDPHSVLADLGFHPVQVRDLRRIPRAVVLAAVPTDELAELALDAVTYHFGSTDLRLHEVEIEAKGGGGSAVVDEIATALLTAFPDELRRWSYGKFPTGAALRELLSAGGLNDLVDDYGTLHPPAYEMVEGVLDPDRARRADS